MYVSFFNRRVRLAAVCSCFLALLAVSDETAAQPENLPLTIPYGFPAVTFPSLDLGDLEGDGDLDLALTGSTPDGPVLEVYVLDDWEHAVGELIFDVKLYRPLNVRARATSMGAVRFADYDGDGDSDMLITGLADYVEGRDRVVEPILELHENDWPPERTLTGYRSPFSRQLSLPGLYRSSADWADYDSDGDLDFVVAGLPALDAREAVTRLYRNDGSSFEPVDGDLPGVKSGDLAWGDVDGDGDPDLALLGDTGDGRYITRVYRNDGGQFVDIGIDAPGLAHGSIDWGDYDNDGDLDLLLTGMTLDPRFLLGVTKIFRNEGGTLVDSQLDVQGLGLGEARWGDADRDGDLDLFIVGSPEALAAPTFRLYSFDGSAYVPTWEYTGNRFAALAVGDYNGDGDADVVIAGALTTGLSVRFLMNWDYPECARMWIDEGFAGNC